MKAVVAISSLAIVLALVAASSPARAQAAKAPAPEAPASSPPADAPPPLPSAAEPTTDEVRFGKAPSAVSPDLTTEGPPRYDVIRINAGVRIGYVPAGGFDAFATNDVLPQFSLDGTYPVLARGKLVLGVGLGWDYGARSATLRGFESSLAVHRLYVPLEARWNFNGWIYGFGKLAPGAAAMMAAVKEGSAPNELKATGWAFSADASVGASILMGPRQHLDRRAVRFWLTPEIGYALTTPASLSGSPGRDEKDLLGSDENAKLGTLALSGFFWRASLGTTF
jgi:hypothetical protein